MMCKAMLYSQRVTAIVLTVFLLSLPALATGTTYYVDDDAADNTGDGLSPGTAWKTIKYAAANVPAGTFGSPNVIMVAAGTYDNTNNGEVFPISFNNDYVSLTGAGSGSTTIDRETAGSGVILSVDAMGFSVSGFTFDNTNEAIDFNYGGFTVNNNIFTSNVTDGIDLYISESDLDTNYTVGNISITNNTFNASTYGIYLNIELDYDEITPGLTASIGNLDINNNTFSGNDSGVYIPNIYITEMYNGTASFGNATFDTNTFTNCSSYGIYFYNYYIDYMYANGTATSGDVLFTGNTMTNCDYGLYLYWFGMEEFYNSTGILGNLTVTNNTVTNGGTYGFYIDYYAFEDIYDGSTMTGGNASITGNSVSGTSSSNIYFAYMYVDSIYSSTASMGNLLFDNNTLTGGSEGIYVYEFYIGNLYGGQGTLGDVTIKNCTLNNHSSESITNDYWGGWDLYGPSMATLGNFNITGNTVTTSPASGYGIVFEYLYDIIDIYDTSTFTTGTIKIANNTVVSYYSALYFYPYYIGDDLGEYSYESPVVTVGDTNITNNKFTSTNSDAAYMYYEYIGYYLYGNAKVYIGATNISNNTFNGNDNGIYYYFDYTAYYMFDNSLFDWKPITINQNTITSKTDDALYIEYSSEDVGYYLNDNARANLPKWTITKNTIDVQGSNDGIAYYNYDNPYNIYDTSTTSYGSVLIDGNTLNPNKDVGMYDGIYHEIDHPCYSCYDYSTAIFGDITVSNNKIYNAANEAIYIYLNAFPYEAYDATTFTGGDINITMNMVDKAAYGVDVEYDPSYAQDIDNVTLGDVNITSNTLTNITSTGVYMYRIHDNYSPGDANFTIGETLIKENMITADAGGGSDGIYFYSEVIDGGITIANPVLSRNTITGFDNGMDLSDSDVNDIGLDEAYITCNWLQNNTTNGLYVDTDSANMMVRRNSIVNNTTNGLFIPNGNAAVINAELNWWGDGAGPAACASCNGVNPGDSGTVDYTPWLIGDINANCGNFPWVMFTPATTGMGSANP